MQKLNSVKNVNEAVEIVRLYNTISFNPKIKESIRNTYTKLFFDFYLVEIVRILNASPTIGMAYYSKEYDLYIGGIPHKNSHYKISH